jgi:hypothetical protein
MVSVPARYVAPPAGEPSPRPAPCRKARGVQRVLGVGGARRGEQPRTERSSCHRADRRRSFSGRRNSSGAIGTSYTYYYYYTTHAIPINPKTNSGAVHPKFRSDAGLRSHGWLCDPRRCCQPSGRDPRYPAMCGLPPGPPASRRCRPAARREFVLGHRRICPRRSARSCPRSCPRHTATLWPRSAPRAPPRSRTTAVGTGSHLAACAGSSRLARGITGLACCCRWLPAPPLLLLLLLTATVCCLLPLLAAVTDLCAPPSPQAHGRHQPGVQRRPGH